MIFLILFIGLVLRLININQSLWLDEAAQVIESARPLREQLRIEGDFQPPLFHLLLHFWMTLGTSEIWMRMLTIALSVFSIFLFYKICLTLVNKKFALLSSFLLTINPYAVYYSQELRPYPLTVFLALLATYGFITNSSLILIIGLSLFLYTSYFAPFFIAALFIYVLVKQRKKLNWFLKNAFISIILFIPWIPKFVEQLRIGTSLTITLPGWGEAVSIPPLKALPLVFAKFFLGRITIDNKIIYGLIILILIWGLLYFLYKSTKNKNWPLFASLFFLPLVFAFVTTLLLPILDPKRLLFILPFFLGIIGLGYLETKKIIKNFVLGCIIFGSVFGLWQYYTNTRFQREQWRQAVSFVETQGDGTQIVLFAFPQPFAPYLWYNNNKIYAYGVAKDFVVSEKDTILIKSLIKDRNQIYLFQYLTDLTDPNQLIQKTIEEEGFIAIDTHDFSGVGFVYEYVKKSLALAP